MSVLNSFQLLPAIEIGNEKAGLQHILDKHGKEFERLGEEKETKLMELAETSTSIGLRMCAQKSRPIFGLFFHGNLLAVAIQAGDNGFVVSMNTKSFDRMKDEVAKHGGTEQLEKLLRELHSWPIY
ncbi:hypothetical protein Asppvi_003879 [Aspergillus pseudoviridinutans]|uniref:Uncharacterized protein n=1 Tax=Aspergillus pseudoviridinutans TaxID=1517512 RepID=A0A9P3B7V0_9EURO|nr:uncharacterized protein Asppvi_003879 [Aspergillus pseudoviridinutans]GIJ85024.1 hypothetical protein Asppvi_003879 [Aspergillus pseudoviridinutans]